MKQNNFFKKSRIIYLCIWALILVLNVAAWHSTAFSDWYIANIFPIWVNTLGRISGLFPFSVGEWMIVAGVLVVLAALVMWIFLFGRLRSVAIGFYRFFMWLVPIICLIMTLNCSILYHASTFSENYFGEDTGEYTLVDLIEVYNLVAEQCNTLAKEVYRDESGTIQYLVGSEGKSEYADMADTARNLMQQLGETYPQLDGYYPRPKALLSSDFMCQQYMCGYYFPFSMEANYNDVMYILNKPASMCHELAHLRGYIYEDEANFISYLACIQSEDVFFKYAGYISVLVYLNNDLYAAWQKNPAAYEEATAILKPVAVDEQVWTDNVFVTEEEWERINKKAVLKTETVEAAADVFVDTNLKVNGISDGIISYSRVVKLLLQYYSNNK